MALGYVFLSKSDVLLENLSMQEYDARLSRNLSAKADLALNWESSLNADGAGFVAARECPPTVSMSGTVSGSTLETVAVAPAIRDGRLVCEGASANATLLRLYYSSDYSTFLTGSYVNDVNINPSGSGTELSGTFADPEGKYLSFALPSGFSPYDRDLNSDDYRTGSTGSVAYPDGYSDNDARARKTAIGLVRNDAGWYAAFWNDPKSDAVIEKNSNNGDSLSAKLPSVSAGYLHFEIDRPFSIRVVEFDSGSYLATGELHRISSEESSSSTGAVGYLQNDLTFSGSRSPGDNARAFDFQNRDYAVFLSYPKESAG
ncbi:MAG: hypothetical protein QG650_790 [Patescibacteria group bacterium]|nr:hypothetical protein [Patescibacteria group bacterium]